MNDVRIEFEERVKELRSHLGVLEELELPGVTIFRPHLASRQHKRLDASHFKLLKASVFLMLYNIVEASVARAFSHLYAQIESERLGYSSLQTELSELWVAQRCKDVFDPSANWKSFEKLARRLAVEVADEEPVALTTSRLPVSGNLDARVIRALCQKHGIRVRTHHRAQGGADLDIVKSQRNALAHGNITFAECGRSFTVDDLREISRRVAIYVRGVLKSLSTYATTGAYRR